MHHKKNELFMHLNEHLFHTFKISALNECSYWTLHSWNKIYFELFTKSGKYLKENHQVHMRNMMKRLAM